MDLTIDIHNIRAQKARLRRIISKNLVRLLFLLAIVLIVSGIVLVVTGEPLGWLALGAAALPYIIASWRMGELEQLAPAKKPKNISDVLDAELLGYIPKAVTMQSVVAAINRTNGGRFFAVRFGLSSNLLLDIAAYPDVSLDEVWKESFRISEELGVSEVTSGMVLAAVVRQLPNHDTLLAHLHIDYGDILDGIKWQLQLKKLITEESQPLRTGGIARDWSFGYTPLLSRFGHTIGRGRGTVTAETATHRQVVERMIETFAGGGTQNATLVGATGVGKTTIVHAFAETLLNARSSVPAPLKFRQVMVLDAASLISAAAGRGQLEGLIMEILGEAYAAKNVIVCLDNAQLFFEEGIGSVDISNILLPIIEAGNLRMILTVDEQRFLQISSRNPTLANALNRIVVAPADENDTMQALMHSLIGFEYKRNVVYSYQSLKEAYRLSLRYVHDVAMPGQAIKLLESAAGYAESQLVTINSVQQAIEQTMDIKVSVASESEDREKLLNLEELIHKRMIGQVRAVEVVSDALRRARAGVRNENRPIGTFLFLGPTGVGKTELAKALADVYFGGENRMIRLDLNEYVRNEDVARLIADGATDPTSLTAQVMKQPYSVILLDEIEKAHPNVLTTLLQLLDEGILRDINNREVSFRDAIVIATSNAGADRIREYIQRGYKLEQFEEQFMNELISSGQFKPEFLNRFDEIVTFGSLSKKELLQIVDLIIVGVNKTLATQKVTVEVPDDAKQLLVDRGYDPRLGARPMRRVVQKAVENTVAKSLLAGEVQPGGVVVVTKDQVEKILGARQLDTIGPVSEGA